MAVRAEKSLVVLTVAALSTLSWWLPLRMGPAPTDPVAVEPEARHVPDFFLNDFELTSMDRGGLPRYHLQAQRMVHYGDTDTGDITAPHVTLFQRAAPSWHGRSAQGWIAAGGEFVILKDDVLIERPGKSKTAPPLQIRSDEMRVWPQREFAETERPVIIHDALGVTHAVGLGADFKQNVLELRTRVRGEYAPP